MSQVEDWGEERPPSCDTGCGLGHIYRSIGSGYMQIRRAGPRAPEPAAPAAYLFCATWPGAQRRTGRKRRKRGRASADNDRTIPFNRRRPRPTHQSLNRARRSWPDAGQGHCPWGTRDACNRGMLPCTEPWGCPHITIQPAGRLAPPIDVRHCCLYAAGLQGLLRSQTLGTRESGEESHAAN